MARKLNQDTAESARRNELSQAERQQRLETAIGAQIVLDRERETFNSAQRKIRNENVLAIVRDVLDMPVTDFNILVRGCKLKNDDKNQERWKSFQASMSSGFAALGLGKQLDFIDVLTGKEPKPRGRKPKAQTEAATSDLPKVDSIPVAKIAGAEAARGGQSLNDNPYDSGTKAFQAWASAYRMSQEAAGSA